jgi:sulfatase maturation enzyme AslB (radical SAM superfamily)
MNRSILHLTIITNGMFKLQDKWKELLRECKHVVFFVSIDACGELCERVREGSKWKTVVETVEDLETEWPVTINTVIHKDNVKGIDDLKKWIDKRPWQINILTFPTHLRVSSDDKQRITRKFNQYFTYTI